jgi:hypothetical protein
MYKTSKDSKIMMMLSFSVTTALMLSISAHLTKTPAIVVPKQHERCRITPAINTAQDQCSGPSRKTERRGSNREEVINVRRRSHDLVLQQSLQ